jgi:hypothetical protein
MACSLTPNVNFDNDNLLSTCASYDSSPNVVNLQPLHEGGGLENPNFVVVDEQTIGVVHLEGLGNKEQCENHTIVIHPLGLYSR